MLYYRKIRAVGILTLVAQVLTVRTNFEFLLGDWNKIQYNTSYFLTATA